MTGTLSAGHCAETGSRMAVRFWTSSMSTRMAVRSTTSDDDGVTTVARERSSKEASVGCTPAALATSTNAIAPAVGVMWWMSGVFFTSGPEFYYIRFIHYNTRRTRY